MIRGFENWLPSLGRKKRPIENALGTRHVMIAICNRFEQSSKAGQNGKPALLESWRRDLSRLADEFRDAQGIAPRHTFFLPAEEAQEEWIGELGELCQTTGNEMELMARPIESADRLRETIQKGKDSLTRKGWLSSDKSGAARYGFIPCASASTSSPPFAHQAILRETGCYASFLPPELADEMPSQIDNSLCYVHDRELENRPDGLRRVRAEREPRIESNDGLLLIPPPMARDWNRKKFGLLPDLEMSELSATKPPSRERLRLWLDCRITVEARPNWVFIALHTNGLEAENSRMLLGEPMRSFYRTLTRLAADDHSLRFHCVTAREFVNILHAAEAGHSGNPTQFREFRYQAPAAFSNRKANCGEIPEGERQAEPAQAASQDAVEAS